MIPGAILANADRLLSDAQHLCDVGRHRAAATPIVVALEQLGQYVQVLTTNKYPWAVAHIGIFDRNNAHSRRQDALAAHVMNFAQGQVLLAVTIEGFLIKTGCADPDRYWRWIKNTVPIHFTEEQKGRWQADADVRTANVLFEAVRQNRLKMLREFGMYEDAPMKFSDATILQYLNLAHRVREILNRSKDYVTPQPMEIAGINMPVGIVVEDTRPSQTIPSLSASVARNSEAYCAN
jgi:hypothetical protein